MSNHEVTATLRLQAKLGQMSAFGALAGKMEGINAKAAKFNKMNSLAATASSAAWSKLGGIVASGALVSGAVRAIETFADIERRMTRIGITAEASAQQTKSAFSSVQVVAQSMALPLDQVVDGLDVLVGSGKSLQDSLAFLPSVAATAQATGADVQDIANSAIGVSDKLKIAGADMQRAFDIMAAGGKAGRFELKDMSAELPSILAPFAALGYSGEAALRKLVAQLQIVREYTGTSSEAATAYSNVLQKMETAQTASAFKKFGIDLPKQMAKARKEGRDLLDTFIQLSVQAVHGDLSKLPRLFTDAQFLQGMRGLIMGADKADALAESLRGAAGVVSNDLNRVLDNTKAKLDHLANTASSLMTSLGAALVSTGVVDQADKVSASLDKAMAVRDYLASRGYGPAEREAILAGNDIMFGLPGEAGAKAAAVYEDWAWKGGHRTAMDRKNIAAYGAYAASRNEGGARTDENGFPIPTPRPVRESEAIPIPTPRPYYNPEDARFDAAFDAEMRRQDIMNTPGPKPRRMLRSGAWTPSADDLLKGSDNRGIRDVMMDDAPGALEAAGAEMGDRISNAGGSAAEAMKAAIVSGGEVAAGNISRALNNAAINVVVKPQGNPRSTPDVRADTGKIIPRGGPQ